MIKPRALTLPNPLASAVDAATGNTARELVAEAAARVSALRPAIRLYVSLRLREIHAFGGESDEVLFAESRTLGDAALAVAETAGAAGMETIGEIAGGISAMVDNLLTQGAWHSDALRLHIQALSLVSQAADGDAPEDRLMLDRLQAMRKVLDVAE
jgi:hypothetical protein